MTEGEGWTRADAREFDRRMIEELGIPGVVLMENAGRSSAEWILGNRERLGLGEGARVGILCGKGNNGGDGYVVARHLSLAGVEVVIGETAEAGGLSDDAGVFRGVCDRMGLSLVDVRGGIDLQTALGPVDLWVDGLLGTGFRPPLEGSLLEILIAVGKSRDASGAPVVALDCPSGIDVDSGALSQGGLRADVTLTFVVAKVGFLAPEAVLALGEIVLIPIGAPSGRP